MAVGLLFAGYVGVYLCRKNLATALPLIRDAFGITKAEAGTIASVSTLAYGIGKMLLGPLVDRLGGRRAFLASLAGVIVFGALGGVAPGLTALVVIYSANRFSGAAAWSSMVKQIPEWFAPGLRARAISVLCLSYVFGGACALWFAGQMARASSNDWRWVMAAPAGILLGIAVICAVALPRPAAVAHGPASSSDGFAFGQLPAILARPMFWVVAVLSFSTTLGRECFNTWTVDFLKSQFSLKLDLASQLSTSFDMGGVVGILGSAWLYDCASRARLRWMTFVVLALLGMLLVLFTRLAPLGLAGMTVAVGVAGLLLYGPYSLLSGALSVEIGGRRHAGTISGLVDSVGYLAGVLAGSGFGRLADTLGYPRAFGVLGIVMLLSAVASLFLFRERGQPDDAVRASA